VSLHPGIRLGPYEILSLLGAGGMGEVWKARDTRLDRIVAVKVLPEQLSADLQLRARLDREARAISSLNHPHICALYDVGHQDGIDFLVLEYLEGRTLADRIATGPLPLREAISIAIQTADALDKAHRAGIVHRDLKPANIFLTRAGTKLLDFGLARTAVTRTLIAGHSAHAQLSAQPTTPPNLTAQGVLLGTFHYMAPEQIEGCEADPRSDVWAFGVILHEMITGRKAFDGRSTAAVMAAILEHDPAPDEFPELPGLAHVLARCLAKDPDERWQTAIDLLHELRWIVTSVGVPPSRATPSTAHLRSRVAWPVGAGVAGLALGGLLAIIVGSRLMPARDAKSPLVTRLLVDISPADQFQSNPIDTSSVDGRPSQIAIALSPDGRSIVFSAVRGGHQQLYLRPLDQLEAMPIAGTDEGASPFFSPDGTSLGFWANGALRKIALAGGPATTVCETARIYGASWGANDTIVFARSTGPLQQVPAGGGTPQAITTLDAYAGELSHRLPHLLPGNAAVLFTVTKHTPPDWKDAEVVIQSLATGQRRVLAQGADARYLPSGHLMYFSSGTAVAAPFDVQRLQLTGGAVSVLSGVMQAANMTTVQLDSGAAQLTTSASGSLLYVPGGISPDPERLLVWVGRNGAVRPLPLPARPYLAPRLSPDNKQLVVWTQGTQRTLWAFDLVRGTLTRVAADGRTSRPIWMPDGRRITFAASTGGGDNLFSKAADGSGTTERLTTSKNQQMPASWSPDGQTLLFIEPTPPSSRIMILHSGDSQTRPLLGTRSTESDPAFSPDGRWIAYVSDESGREDVYVQAFPTAGPRFQISNRGGTAPAWSRHGELFYTETDRAVPASAPMQRMMAVSVTAGTVFTAGLPRALFEGRFTIQTTTGGYDVTADGQRFLMVQPKDRPPARATQMIYVQNWFAELRHRVSAK
jgi:serine/threonine protein kinase/Tol biopolymer transport system component